MLRSPCVSQNKENQIMSTNVEYPVALQKVSADGKYRLTVRYDECAEHPLLMCDFPLHMDDWSRNYTANPTRWTKNKDHSDSMESCMIHLLAHYGDQKKIIDLLVQNGKEQFHEEYDNALIYDRHRKEWVLGSWVPTYRSYTGETIEAHWSEEWSFCCKREHIETSEVLDYLSTETLAHLLDNCMTDECKVMSYDFGYHGSISFYSNVYDSCCGLAWIVKSEAVGDGKWLTEEQWNAHDCYTLTSGEREEMEAWADGEAFWFEVEKNVKWKVHRECLSEEREAEDYVEEEWEQVDSCCGFYGLNHAVQYAIEEHGQFKMLAEA